MIVRYFTGCIFLFIIINVSMEFQLKKVFIPWYTEKIKVNVSIDSMCAKQILSENASYKIPKNCLSCTPFTEHITIKQCNFSTTSNANVDVAKDLISKNGINFSTFGYLQGNRLDLRHKPIELINFHIFLWSFGLLIFFFIVNGKFKLSKDL